MKSDAVVAKKRKRIIWLTYTLKSISCCSQSASFDPCCCPDNVFNVVQVLPSSLLTCKSKFPMLAPNIW